MIGVRFHDGTSVEYPEATKIHTSAAPRIDIIDDDLIVIAELDARDIKELYNDEVTKNMGELV